MHENTTKCNARKENALKENRTSKSIYYYPTPNLTREKKIC